MIDSGAGPLTFAQVIESWRASHAFRAFFMTELASTRFPAFFWEMPPICGGRTDFPYEYVAISSDTLDGMTADPSAFGEKLVNTRTSHSVVAFANLGRDALLIAPKPVASRTSYGHLAAFLRSSTESQRHALFQYLGRALLHVLRICDGRVWTSTSGLGIPWLHLRLDSVPKYYNYAPYRDG